MADHEDYLPGELPAHHKVTHQNGGADEISIAGLAGESAELGAHKILPAIHHLRYTDVEAQLVVDAELVVHSAVTNAHHARYTDAEARASINDIFGADGKADSDIDLDTHKLNNVVDPAAAQDADTKNARDAAIATHTAIATAHQDAPTLIATHAAIAAAHHAKYTDAEVRVLFSPISVPPPAFQPKDDTYDWTIDDYYLRNRTSVAEQVYTAPVFFPDGVTVTKLTLYAFRNDADASINLYLRRIGRAYSHLTMALVTCNWTDGWGSLYDDTIDSGTIDNATYSYVLELILDPNDSASDVYFAGAMIDFTG